MKKLTYTVFFFFCLFVFITAEADVAPSPREIRGIVPATEHSHIRMKSERVEIDLYQDSALVTCLFNMFNYGEETTLEVGFPEMYFYDRNPFELGAMVSCFGMTPEQAWVECKKEYSKHISMKVDGRSLTIDNLYVNSKNVYDSFNNKESTILPWLTWIERFEAHKAKKILVSYTMPNGWEFHGDKHYTASLFRVFKYILSTGAGWYKSIGKATVIVRLHDIEPYYIDGFLPIGGKYNDKEMTISWKFKNLEPTAEDNISIVFYNSKDRIAQDYWINQSEAHENNAPGKWYLEQYKK